MFWGVQQLEIFLMLVKLRTRLVVSVFHLRSTLTMVPQVAIKLLRTLTKGEFDTVWTKKMNCFIQYSHIFSLKTFLEAQSYGSVLVIQILLSF